MSRQTIAFNVCRAIEAFEDARDDDDDVKAERQRRLDVLAAQCRNLSAPGDYQGRRMFLVELASAALTHHARGDKKLPLCALKLMQAHQWIAPHCKDKP